MWSAVWVFRTLPSESRGPKPHSHNLRFCSCGAQWDRRYAGENPQIDAHAARGRRGHLFNSALSLAGMFGCDLAVRGGALVIVAAHAALTCRFVSFVDAG